MIETIPNLPTPLVGVRVTAKVTAEDYETVLIPAIEAAIKEHGSVRLLYVLECGMKDFSAGAMWDDAKLGISHLQDFERVAIVTDDHLVRATLRAFHFAMPKIFEIFHAGEDDAAIEWLTTT
jgi:hypothetical protein